MDRLQRLLHPGMGGEGPPGDSAQVDTSEQVYISSLALIKMLKHGEFQSQQYSNVRIHHRLTSSLAWPIEP